MHKLWLLFCFFFILIQIGWSQNVLIDSLRTEFDKLYGLDVVLNNGKKYIPEATTIKGHPFWNSLEPFKGDLIVLGKHFPNQKLKYDLYKQNFLLEYIGQNEQKFQVLLNTPFIDTVRTELAVFVRNPYTMIPQPFVKVIYKGDLSCFASLKKDLKFINIGVDKGYEYSSELQKFYLVKNDSVYSFNRKSVFLKYFPSEKRSVIRSRIAFMHLNFRHMDEFKLEQLVEFCDQTLRNN